MKNTARRRRTRFLNKLVSVTDSVPMRDVLMELVRKTGANLELDPRVQGSVIITAHDQKWTPGTSRDDLRVLEVTANEVRFLLQGAGDATPQEITLRPNQSYQIGTGKIVFQP
jgi:hypothetical protein